MSITNELREWWVRNFPVMDKELHEEFTAIARSIDTEHVAALKSLGMAQAERDEYLESCRLWEFKCDSMMELPRDADGEPIHVGDVMDSRVDYLFDGKPFTVRALVLCEDGWEVADGRFGNRYEPDSLRHHHAPTVEDVLREMADRCYADEDEPRDRDAIVAEFAAKLRLADE